MEDVASAVHAAILANRVGINIYTIGNSSVPLMNNFYGLFCLHLKKKIPYKLPYWALLFPSIILELLYLLLKSKTPPLLTRGRLYMMYANNIYQTNKAKKEINFEATTDLNYAVRKTVKWWKLYRYL